MDYKTYLIVKKRVSQMMDDKQTFVRKYGANAEDVMYKIALEQIKKDSKSDN